MSQFREATTAQALSCYSINCMSYQFVKEQSISDNIQRILTEELDEAIRSLENPGQQPDETIHSVRKRIKKIRALFRLVRKGMGPQLFAQENIRYRDMGHQLSHLRDATVMVKTLDKLASVYPGQLPSEAFTKVRESLLARQKEVSKAFFENENGLQNVLAAFKEAREKAPQNDLLQAIEKDSFRVFYPNMKAIYKRGAKALEVVQRQPSIDAFHELRKEVKHLWYHTRLLGPVWPGLLQAYSEQLGQLGELLGDDHDLGVLAEQIASGQLTFDTQATANTFLVLVQQQRKQIQQQVYPLAQRIFSEKAEDFASRYRLYWNIWRAEK